MDRSEALVPMRQEVVRLEVTQLVNQATNRYKRQAVVPDAAGVLSSAGLLDESDRILKAELPRTVAPYMVVLASNAKKRGNKASARGHQKDPATRLQWGAAYVRQLVALAPNDADRLSHAAAAVIETLRPEG